MTAQWPPTYTIRRSNKARRLQLQFHPSRGLEVVIPCRTRHVDVDELLNTYQSWIESRLDRSIDSGPVLLPNLIELSMLSEAWRVEYIEQSNWHHKVIVKENLATLHLSVYYGGNVDESRTIIFCKLRDWCIKKSAKYLMKWIQQLSEQIGLRYRRVTIKSMSSCWGSCTALNNISLNYQLIFLPPECVRYVLLHELCHLQHLNHSQAFWELLKKWDPNAILHRKRCRQAQATLPNWLSFQ